MVDWLMGITRAVRLITACVVGALFCLHEPQGRGVKPIEPIAHWRTRMETKKTEAKSKPRELSLAELTGVAGGSIQPGDDPPGNIAILPGGDAYTILPD